MARKPTQQTLENLQRGREKRLQNILDRYAQDLTNRYIPKVDGDTLSIEAARSKIEYVSREEGLTRRKAYEKIKVGRSFTSKEQHFRNLIARNLNHNVSMKNRLRWMLSDADGTPYKQTRIDLSKFTLDKHGAYYNGITIEVVPKADSLSVDLLIINYKDVSYTTEYEE